MTMTWVIFAWRALASAASSSAIELTLTASAPRLRAWATKSIVRQRLVPGVAQQVVEQLAAGGALQAVGLHSDVRPAEGDLPQSRSHFRAIVGGLAIGRRLDWFTERLSWEAFQHYQGPRTC